MQLISNKIQIIRYLSLVRSVAYGESEVKLFACKAIINRWEFSFSKGEKWYDKLFNVKYLPLFHHFKDIYQFPKHIIFLVKIVANTSLKGLCRGENMVISHIFSHHADAAFFFSYPELVLPLIQSQL